MMCPLKKFIFIHIPKTAGTSIEQAILGLPNIHDGKKDHLDDVAHSSIAVRLYHNNNLVEAINSNPDFKLFAFIRNPWDRFVSLYRHSMRVRSHPNNKHFSAKEAKQLSFDEYLEMIIAGRSKGSCDALDYFCEFDWFHTQYTQVEHFPDYNGDPVLSCRKPFYVKKHQKWNAPISAPNGYLESGIDLSDRKVEFVGRFENLNEDYLKLQDFLGTKLPALGKCDHASGGPASYKNFYNSRTERLLGNFYKQDVDYFNYSF